MLLLLDLLVRRALGWLGRGSSIHALELENAVLRHEVRLLVGSRNPIAGLRPAAAVRSATMPRRDQLPPLSPPAPGPSPGPFERSPGGRGGTRGRRAATPGRHPAPAGEAAGLPCIRQGVPRRREQGASAGGVGRVPGPAGDAPPVAPAARP